MLAQVGLSTRERHYPKTLSGGEQQRVALARAFVSEPAVLFADEPTGSLDAATGEGVMNLIFALNRTHGSTLVLVTHDPGLAAKAQRVVTMRAGAIVALSYLGAVRSIPGYNVMGLAKASLEANVRFLAADLGPQGIRVNGISAGPIKTLSAAGIPGLRKMLSHVASAAPIRRNVTIDDVGNAAAFLCSDLAAGISGEMLYVDGGFHTVGMSFPSDGDGA